MAGRFLVIVTGVLLEGFGQISLGKSFIWSDLWHKDVLIFTYIVNDVTYSNEIEIFTSYSVEQQYLTSFIYWAPHENILVKRSVVLPYFKLRTYLVKSIC